MAPAANISHSRNPAWDLYDEYRTARLNAKYYTCLLRRLIRRNFWVEWILAATAPTSAIAVLAVWEFPAGKAAWGLLATTAGVLAVYKPLGKLTDRIRQLEERVTKYRAIEFELKNIATEMRASGKYSASAQDQLREAVRKKEELALSYTDPSLDSALIRRCQDEVNKESPANRFYIPKEVEA